MQYYDLKSIVGSGKQPIPLKSQSASFFLNPRRPSPYIEPTFSKEEFPTKKPAILLVSAVGASGKTTTAHALACDSILPVLDLAKHKTVADNTLTGILTSAYPIEKIGEVLEGLRTGTHGIIIDGIDEGRTKTNEPGFEAFLDDLIERSKGATTTSIVIFGRSQVLINTWLYLAEKGADVGLVKIDPFSLDHAKKYIDAYVTGRNPDQQAMYEQARDSVLDKLGAAFSPSEAEDGAFLSFIGYPPVLDAIATLLREEQNYYRINQALSDGANGNLEVGLLIRIANYLLNRERTEKAKPNFIDGIADEADAALADVLRGSLYDRAEQSARILSRGLGKPFPKQVIADNALNEQYEKALETWCPEHPFLDDNRVRNAVFEAVAVAHCALSDVEEYQALADEYTQKRQPTYHLLYIMAILSSGQEIGVGFFNMLIQSCSEFLSSRGDIEIEIAGVSWEEPDVAEVTSAELELRIQLPGQKLERSFCFSGRVAKADSVLLGPYLVNTSVTLPCGVEIKGSPAIECSGMCRIVAKTVSIDAADLVVRAATHGGDGSGADEPGLFIDVSQAQGHAIAVTPKAGTVEIGCIDHGLSYPLARYVRQAEKTPADPDLVEKFRRLRRIMQEFASHSKGKLAKYRPKIEHERVLRGAMGENVLAQLLKEKILHTDPKFYFVDSDKLAQVLGTTWHELRQRKLSKSLEAFLKRVP